jgi:hypothetical protein
MLPSDRSCRLGHIEDFLHSLILNPSYATSWSERFFISVSFFFSQFHFQTFFTSMLGFLWTDKFNRVLLGQFINDLILNLARRRIRSRDFKINLLNRV